MEAERCLPENSDPMGMETVNDQKRTPCAEASMHKNDTPASLPQADKPSKDQLNETDQPSDSQNQAIGQSEVKKGFAEQEIPHSSNKEAKVGKTDDENVCTVIGTATIPGEDKRYQLSPRKSKPCSDKAQVSEQDSPSYEGIASDSVSISSLSNPENTTSSSLKDAKLEDVNPALNNFQEEERKYGETEDRDACIVNPVLHESHGVGDENLQNKHVNGIQSEPIPTGSVGNSPCNELQTIPPKEASREEHISSAMQSRSHSSDLNELKETKDILPDDKLQGLENGTAEVKVGFTPICPDMSTYLEPTPKTSSGQDRGSAECQKEVQNSSPDAKNQADFKVFFPVFRPVSQSDQQVLENPCESKTSHARFSPKTKDSQAADPENSDSSDKKRSVMDVLVDANFLASMAIPKPQVGTVISNQGRSYEHRHACYENLPSVFRLASLIDSKVK